MPPLCLCISQCRCTVAAARANTKPMWHICVLRHYSSWDSTLNPSLKMFYDGHFPPLWQPFETRRVIMIIQLLMTFTYSRKWTVERAVCMHGELIKVFFISLLTYVRHWLFGKTGTNFESARVWSYRATAGKQTDMMTRGQSSGAHSRYWDINANPPTHPPWNSSGQGSDFLLANPSKTSRSLKSQPNQDLCSEAPT